MRRLLFAANWKMQLGPAEARDYAVRFRARFTPSDARDTWFFPPAVSLEAAAQAFRGLPNTQVGAQDIHWEPKGAFTGAVSAGLAKGAGATAVLIGHSERRHGFGESDADTAKKLRAALREELTPVLCVGEKLEEREAGKTEAVVRRQLLAAIEGLRPAELGSLVVAYEPVWAIGTGRNATPSDAAQVHAGLRRLLGDASVRGTRILYGGSVKQGNVAALLAEKEIEGVLVGGASLDPEGWAGICAVGR
ncbi:MAG TPA: triose-phosphate isomerase [Gemmatimonadales bacterium]|jgi:triosephosphate isomerase|nr:triose-phosphate isomerase [Gemmatimonadales bacterium]